MRKFGWVVAALLILAGGEAKADGVTALTFNCASGQTCTSTSMAVESYHLESVSCEWSSGTAVKAEFVITDPSQAVTDKQFFIVSVDERKARAMSRQIQRWIEQGTEMGLRTLVVGSTASVKFTTSASGANKGTCYVNYRG